MLRLNNLQNEKTLELKRENFKKVMALTNIIHIE